MTPVKKKFRSDRLPYLAAAALFLFFLVYSAPHRVHHAFDSDDAAPCVAFSVAKSCHLQLASTVDFSVTQIASESVVPSLESWTPSFTPAPFSQRAPPRL